MPQSTLARANGHHQQQQQQQQSTPPVPKFILRGHTASIHALLFLPASISPSVTLVSGDADGWLVLWSLATKRAIAVWRGHEGGVLGVRGWDGGIDAEKEGRGMLVSHGRDHKLRIWQLPTSSHDVSVAKSSKQHVLSTRLPVDGATADSNPWPWLLYSFSVNALNYCAFSMCEVPLTQVQQYMPVQALDSTIDSIDQNNSAPRTPHQTLLASPNGLDTGGIDIFSLPSGLRVSRIPSEKSVQTGMVMAVSLFRPPDSNIDTNTNIQGLILVCGYESGYIVMYQGINSHNDGGEGSEEWKWQRILCVKPHTQPVLALAVSPDASHSYTSSADAMIIKYRIPHPRLIPHTNDGVKAVDIKEDDVKPVKVSDTKHAGQQDLSIRDDGKIFATAGWDGRVRIYSCKSLKEVAVLKWHREGCYAVAFKNVVEDGEDLGETRADAENRGLGKDDNADDAKPKSTLVVNAGLDTRKEKSPLDQLKTDREMEAQSIHWLAAGGKDGKISLWDIY